MARRWIEEEGNVSVEKVEENYHFLTSALSATFLIFQKCRARYSHIFFRFQ